MPYSTHPMAAGSASPAELEVPKTSSIRQRCKGLRTSVGPGDGGCGEGGTQGEPWVRTGVIADAERLIQMKSQ